MGEIDWLAVGLVIVGILVTTGGGLLSLLPDPERPVKFVPVYVLALLLFCGGLALVLWSQEAGQYLTGNADPQTQQPVKS